MHVIAGAVAAGLAGLYATNKIIDYKVDQRVQKQFADLNDTLVCFSKEMLTHAIEATQIPTQPQIRDANETLVLKQNVTATPANITELLGNATIIRPGSVDGAQDSTFALWTTVMVASIALLGVFACWCRSAEEVEEIVEEEQVVAPDAIMEALTEAGFDVESLPQLETEVEAVTLEQLGEVGIAYGNGFVVFREGDQVEYMKFDNSFHPARAEPSAGSPFKTKKHLVEGLKDRLETTEETEESQDVDRDAE